MDSGRAISTALDAMGTGANDLSHQSHGAAGDRGVCVFTEIDVLAKLVIRDVSECFVQVEGFRGFFQLGG